MGVLRQSQQGAYCRMEELAYYPHEDNMDVEIWVQVVNWEELDFKEV